MPICLRYTLSIFINLLIHSYYPNKLNTNINSLVQSGSYIGQASQNNLYIFLLLVDHLDLRAVGIEINHDLVFLIKQPQACFEFLYIEPQVLQHLGVHVLHRQSEQLVCIFHRHVRCYHVRQRSYLNLIVHAFEVNLHVFDFLQAQSVQDVRQTFHFG